MKRILIVLVSICLIFSFAACKKSADELNTGMKDSSEELYVEVSCLWNLEYFNDHKLGMELAGKYLGVKTETVGPAEWDVAGMVAAMEQAIAKKPAGIVVCAMDPALNDVTKQAIDAGIPVVNVDADQPSSSRLAFVGTGNKAAGETGGHYLAKLINEKGDVAILTMPTQDNHQKRVAGYKEALAKYPNIKIVQMADTEADVVKSAQAATTLIQKYPNLAAIICTDSTGGAGAATAVRESSKIGKIKIMSMDRGTEILQAIDEGVISASLVQQTVLMPYYAVVMMHNMHKGDFPVTKDNKAAGVTGAPIDIDTGTVIVDKSNVKYFMK